MPKIVKSISKMCFETDCIMCTKRCVAGSFEDEQLYGKIVEFVFDGKRVKAHMFCIYSAPLGEQQDEVVEGEREAEIAHIRFTLKSIRAEIYRGRRLKCKYCRQSGAIHGCMVHKCNVGFHFSCGQKNGILFLARNNFATYCPKHIQIAARKDHPWALALKMKNPVPESAVCSICCDDFEKEVNSNILNPFCCRIHFIHRKCLQGYANVVGRTGITCMFCKNHLRFKGWCFANGIFMEKKISEVEISARAIEEQIEAEEHYCEICSKHDKFPLIVCESCGREMHETCSVTISDSAFCEPCSKAEANK